MTQERHPDLLVPDLPESVPVNEPVSVRGVVPTGSQTLEWLMIHAGDSGGYVLDGLNDFVEIDLAKQSGSESAPTTEGASGEATGDLHGVISRDSKGEYGLSMMVDEVYGWYYLSGTVPEGLKALYGLPVVVSGWLGEPVDGHPSVIVDTYREEYPGLSFQAWMGTYESTNLEGENALLFTTIEGETYVLFNSLPMDRPAGSSAGKPGESIIVEGLVIPGKTFGGYPVIYHSMATLARERTNLDGYSLESGKTLPFDNTTRFGLSAGKAVVDNIELVYIATGTSHGDMDESVPQYAQPAWRFTGVYENGDRLEILVQALRGE